MTNWPVKTLGEVSELFTGGTPSTGNKSYYDGGQIKWLRSGDVHQREIYDCEGRITEEGMRNANTRYLPLNSVLIALAGQGKTRGTVAMLRTQATCNQSVVSIMPIDPKILLPEFVFWNLHMKYDEIRRMTGDDGNDRRGLNMRLIRSMTVPIAPLEEQKRIVALLDDATARITELTACYEQACARANDLLESSLLELFASAFESHPKRKMGEVLQIARGGSPRPISEYITKSREGVNWIKIGDASASKKYIFETAEKIKPEGVSRSRMVFPGDFLLSNSMSFGRPYIMKTEGCIHDGWLVLRDSKGELDQDFLFYLLGSQFMHKRFSQLAAGSTVQNLNSSLVSNVEIPVPPLDFQKEIAIKASLVEEKVSKLKENFGLQLQAMEDLKQSILEAAFAGEL
jgi:type I restriction enzyme S subunit